MINALDLTSSMNYVSKYDSGEVKTVWSLGILDTRIRKMLEDLSWEYEIDPSKPGTGTAKSSFNLGKSELEFVAFGLKGFKKFSMSDTGKPVHFKTEERCVGQKVYQVLASSVIDIIPSEVVKELAEQIKNFNKVNEVEAKN